MADKKPNKKEAELEQHLGELTADLQRVQADFINYRARMDEDRQRQVENAKAATILKLLPVVDNIERAINHVPPELADNTWARGVQSLSKSLDKSLAELGVTRIVALGQPFDPHLHEAISADDNEGDHEIVVEELRAGYKLGGQVIRPSLVRVSRHSAPEAEPPEVTQQVIDDTKSAEATNDEVKGED